MFCSHVKFFDISSQSVPHSIVGWGLLCKKLAAFYTRWVIFNSFFLWNWLFFILLFIEWFIYLIIYLLEKNWLLADGPSLLCHIGKILRTKRNWLTISDIAETKEEDWDNHNKLFREVWFHCRAKRWSHSVMIKAWIRIEDIK